MWEARGNFPAYRGREHLDEDIWRSEVFVEPADDSDVCGF
jgi:hypothetical protein